MAEKTKKTIGKIVIVIGFFGIASLVYGIIVTLM